MSQYQLTPDMQFYKGPLGVCQIKRVPGGYYLCHSERDTWHQLSEHQFSAYEPFDPYPTTPLDPVPAEITPVVPTPTN